MSVAENVLDRLGFIPPKVLNNSDYSSTYKVEDPLGKQGIDESPYLAGQDLKIVTTRQSNELTDFRHAYLVYEDIIQFKSTSDDFQTVSDHLNQNPYGWPVMCNGLPFSARVENVNGNVEISNCQNTFNRFTALNMLCSHQGIEGGTVHSPDSVKISVTGTPNNEPVMRCWDNNLGQAVGGQNIVGFVSVTQYGLISNAYCKYFSTLMSRSIYQRVLSSTGTPLIGQKRHQILPIEVVSRLASSPHLIPTGLMSQTSTYGWSLTLTLASDTLQWVMGNTTPDSIWDSNYAPVYQLTNPKFVSRVVKIHNPTVLDTLIDDFNFRPRRIPLGEDGEVIEVTKNILIPFNNSSYHTDRVVAGTSSIKVRYAIEEKGLKGAATRFSSDALYSDRRFEKNILDYNLNWKNYQWTIGSYRVPEDTINVYDNSQFKLGRFLARYSQREALHLFDPQNTFAESLNPLDKLYAFNENGYQATAKFNSLLVSFENFAMKDDESGDTAHSFGVNTYLLGNVATLSIELFEPLPADITVETEFVFQDVLLVGNGSIQRVYNKTVMNEPVQMK